MGTVDPPTALKGMQVTVRCFGSGQITALCQHSHDECAFALWVRLHSRHSVSILLCEKRSQCLCRGPCDLYSNISARNQRCNCHCLSLCSHDVLDPALGRPDTHTCTRIAAGFVNAVVDADFEYEHLTLCVHRLHPIRLYCQLQ